MTEPAYRISFERDEGQGYEVGARVSVHPMDAQFRTVRLNPAGGNYLVTRCERIRDTAWQALRISLQPWIAPITEAACAVLVADALATDTLATDARQ